MGEEAKKSPHAILIIDEKRDTILSALYNAVNRNLDAKLMFNAALMVHGVTNDDVDSFIKDWTEKEHERGWCKDPNCPENKKTI